MKNPTNEQIAKLPVWAQQHIAQLQDKLASAEEEAKILYNAQTEMAGSSEDDSLVVWSVLMKDYPLPRRAMVRFGMEKGMFIEVGLGENSRGGRALRVRASDGIVIRPEAGNSASISIERFGRDV